MTPIVTYISKVVICTMPLMCCAVATTPQLSAVTSVNNIAISAYSEVGEYRSRAPARRKESVTYG